MAEDLNIKKKKSEALRFLGKGKIDKAIQVYEDILKIKEDPDIYNAVGDLYVRKQNISRAIESYEKAFKLYKNIEFLDNAVAVIRKILKYERDRKDLYLELADLYTELGNQDAAIEALENVITEDLDPSMIERAFSIVTQLAEKVQEDESSIRRFERLFLKLQEISERFGEISLESGMGMDVGMEEEEAFTPPQPTKEEEEEGLILEDSNKPSLFEQPPRSSEMHVSDEVESEESLIFEEEGEEKTSEIEVQPPNTEESISFMEEEKVEPVKGLKGDDSFYTAPETYDEELVLDTSQPEEESVISETENAKEMETPIETSAGDEFKENVDILEVESQDEITSELESESVIEEGSAATSELVIGEPENISTEEVTSRKTPEHEKPPTTTKQPEPESKYYEEFKDIVLTLIEEMGEADIEELYDFSHPFEIAMTLYKMDLFDAAIDEFQRAMRESEYRLKAMEMIGRIFFEMNNHKMAIKMLEKAIEEGGYEEHEYDGIRYYLGRAYEAIGLEDKALEHYEQLYLINRNYRDVSERMDALRLKRVKSF